MSRGVLLVVNRSKPDAASAHAEVRALILRAGGKITGECDTPLSPSSIPARDREARPAVPAGTDLVVVLGGDGTLIHEAKRYAHSGLPLLGVNFGKVGFLAEFDHQALRDQAPALFGSAPLELVDRALLRVALAPHAEPSWALNDCVVTAGPPFRMIAIEISIDGSPGPTITGDGLLISTPMGSTAYNAAAGGPILAPDTHALALTPIAAHSLSFRPVVVAGASTIRLTMQRVNDDHAHAPGEPGGGTTLVLDGQLHHRLAQGDRIEITLKDKAVRLVRNPRTSYWSTLIQKMQWAAPPRGR